MWNQKSFRLAQNLRRRRENQAKKGAKKEFGLSGLDLISDVSIAGLNDLNDPEVENLLQFKRKSEFQ